MAEQRRADAASAAVSERVVSAPTAAAGARSALPGIYALRPVAQMLLPMNAGAAAVARYSAVHGAVLYPTASEPHGSGDAALALVVPPSAGIPPRGRAGDRWDQHPRQARFTQPPEFGTGPAPVW